MDDQFIDDIETLVKISPRSQDALIQAYPHREAADVILALKQLVEAGRIRIVMGDDGPLFQS